jgi:hypothetical protein
VNTKVRGLFEKAEGQAERFVRFSMSSVRCHSSDLPSQSTVVVLQRQRWNLAGITMGLSLTTGTHLVKAATPGKAWSSYGKMEPERFQRQIRR